MTTTKLLRLPLLLVSFPIATDTTCYYCWRLLLLQRCSYYYYYYYYYYYCYYCYYYYHHYRY